MPADTMSTGALVLAPPAILLAALNAPEICYKNHFTRGSTLVAVAASAVGVITQVKISNPSAAFMTGLMECWMIIWASVLLLRFDPTRNFARVRWHKAPLTPNEFLAEDRVWQRYPQAFSVERLSWTMNLLISFRRVGWSTDPGESSPSAAELADRSRPI